MVPAKESRTLEPFVESLKMGDSVGHLNLTLVPLMGGEGHGQLDYCLAADAIAAGVFTVTEMSQGGTVPLLTVVSEATRMVLLLDGEELVGAKQNRILNTSVLVPAKSKINIPVSCVEQGRWRHVSPDFKSGGYSPSHLRARKSRDVGRNLRATGQAMSDQGAVWEDVAATHADLGSSSPTMAMHDAIDQRRDALDGYVEALAYPAGARGIFVAINGRFTAIDLFDKPATLERIWSRLLTGYALDALARLNQPETAFVPRGPQAVLERLGTTACQACPSVGVGEDWRFETELLVGQALVADGVCVHLSVFPNEAEAGRRNATRESEIQPPSRRRNHKRPPEDRVY